VRRGLPLLLCLLLAAPGPAPEAAPEAAWFRDVAASAGLSGVAAKDCLFTDLDGDGHWDLCLDRRHLFLARDGGRRFERHEQHGIAFPVVRRVPLAEDGRPDEAKAKTGPYVPQYLYFADLDDDGNQDAVWGVKSWWEHFDGTAWHTVPACDPGVRTTVWLGTGGGRFRRGPASTLTSPAAVGPAMALAIVDYDGDGHLDLYEGREYRRYGVLENCGVDRLWKGDGRGGFKDVTKAAGLWTGPEPGASRPTYGVTHVDWNDDGRTCSSSATGGSGTTSGRTAATARSRTWARRPGLRATT
jgi:hypothetical protein